MDGQTYVGEFSILKDEEIMLLGKSLKLLDERRLKVFDHIDVSLHRV